jgi:hypothetical protein
MDKFTLELEEALLRFDDPTYFDVSKTCSTVYHRFLQLGLKDRPASRPTGRADQFRVQRFGPGRRPPE